MSLDKFDATLARADRVMARVDERQGATGDARKRDIERRMGGYGRAFTKATIAAVVIIIGALALGLLNPIGIIGFIVAVGIAIAAFGLIFFGVACLVRGYLIFESGYLPKFLGVLMAIAGLSYLINSFALLLAPAFASVLFPAVLLPAFVGELAFALWLILKGVNLGRWEKLVQLSSAK